MKFLDKLLGRNTLQPKPLEVNPSNPAQLKRHVGRLVTLYMAIERDPYRADVLAEISQRQQAIRQFGHDAPSTLDEARALQSRMRV